MKLFVWNHDFTAKIPALVSPVSHADLEATKNWQTQWTSKVAHKMPNKVALRRSDDNELLGLMSYEIDEDGLAIEVIYLESAAHSNANLLHQFGTSKKYNGIAKALLAYAISISIDLGFDGVIYFKAKTSRLRDYYISEFGAMPISSYDPFRLIIWEDAAQELVSEFL